MFPCCTLYFMTVCYSSRNNMKIKTACMYWLLVPTSYVFFRKRRLNWSMNTTQKRLPLALSTEWRAKYFLSRRSFPTISLWKIKWPLSRRNFDRWAITWTILIEVQLRMLHTNYLSPADKNIFKFSNVNLYKIMYHQRGANTDRRP